MSIITNECSNCEGKGVITSPDPHYFHIIIPTVTCHECEGLGYIEFQASSFNLSIPIRYDEGSW